jgi:hypothetical protein
MALHVINTLPLLMIAVLLFVDSKQTTKALSALNHHKLSWSAFYLTVGVVLLTALPGTVSFIELYSLLSIAYLQSTLAVALAAVIFILLAAVTLKLLHQYVLIPQITGPKTPKQAILMHGFCVTIITLTIMAGMIPQYFVY